MGGIRPTKAIRGDDVPPELRARPQWVNWRWELRDDKWTKPPIDAKTGRAAKSTDPSTWATYEQAVAVAPPPLEGGIGYVLSPDDPYAAIDVDACRDVDTGTIDAAAQQIITDLGSYTEVSPSGTGIRILVKGKLPPGGRKHGHVEAYDKERYVTITGAHVADTPLTIESRTDQLTTFHANWFPAQTTTAATTLAQTFSTNGPAPTFVSPNDAAIIAKAMQARGGDKFTRLWSGSLADAEGDHSKADLLLCGMLAFWTRCDAARMDGLFRQSGLMRKKWDQRHHGDGRTYGQGTIAVAISQCRETYSPEQERRLRVVRDDEAKPERHPLVVRAFAQILDEEDVPLVYQWPGWCADGRLYIYAGAGDSMKSWLLLYEAMVTASGRPMFDRGEPCLQGPAIVVSAENGYEEDKRRIKILQRGHGFARDLPLHHIAADALSIRDPETLAEFHEFVAKIKPRFIGVDSAIAVAELENENDNAEVHRFLREVVIPLSRTHGATTKLIAHSPKPPIQKGLFITDEQVARGASAWRNAVDGILYLRREKSLGSTAAVVRQAKVRVGRRAAPFWFSIEDVALDDRGNTTAAKLAYGGEFSEETSTGESAALTTAAQVAHRVVLDAASTGVTVADVVEHLARQGVAKSTARRAADVIRGRFPWPSGLYAGKKQSVVDEVKDRRATRLTPSATVIEEPGADDDPDDADVPF